MFFSQDCPTLLPKLWWMAQASVTPQTQLRAHWTLNGTSIMICKHRFFTHLLFCTVYTDVSKLAKDFFRCAFRYIGKTDSITISVWNHKKIHKKQGAGFLGCVRLLSNAISRLKDTGCEFDLLISGYLQNKTHTFCWILNCHLRLIYNRPAFGFMQAERL